MRATKLSEFAQGSEVIAVSYEPDTLAIGLGMGQTVRFDDIVGFRLLDERDLREFWPECSAKYGGLFEVLEGGWLEQESARPGFVSATVGPKLREYLVTGPNSCVNVFTYRGPRFSADAV